MGAYAPAGFCNKKAPKFFPNLGANVFMHCILLLWESQEWRLEPNILTRCVGQKPLPFRKAFPAPASDRATAPSERTYTLQCRFCVGDFHPVSLYFAPQRKAVFLNMPIFTCKLIMNLFVHFVNIFTQKNSKNSKNGSVPHRAHFEHCFLPLCSRCWGKTRPLSTK